MTDYGFAERYGRFLALAGIPNDARWLNPPITDTAIESAQQDLGFELPADLVELFRVHNGVNLFDVYQWFGCVDGRQAPLAGHSKYLNDDLLPELRANDTLTMVDPGPRTLYIAGEAHVGIFYDMDEIPGRLMHLSITEEVSVVPLCRDLTTLVDAYLALAEAGHITVRSIGPLVGPDGQSRPQSVVDEVTDILLAHNVAPAFWISNDGWLAHPEAATFTID